MNRILIATDGSQSSEEALELGIELAAEQGTPATIVHVIPIGELRTGPAFERPEQDEVLREAAAAARRAGVEPDLKLLSGDIAHEIAWLAEKLEADMVLVGSRGRGAVHGALLGSVSRSVLAECTRPVVIVRPTRVAASV